MNKLREMKRQAQGITNKYCDGVAKKLEDQVKKLLKVYNYSFECAEGLDDLITQRDKDRKELDFLRLALQRLK